MVSLRRATADRMPTDFDYHRFASHWKWVVMLIVLFLAMVIGWVGACLLRRRITRKREREFEMRPPVAWGPHQLQGMTGGYAYGDGVVNAPGGRRAPAPPVSSLDSTVMDEKMAAAAAAAAVASAPKGKGTGEKGEKTKGSWLQKRRG